MARTNEVFRLESLSDFIDKLNGNLRSSIEYLTPSQLEKSNDILISELTKQRTIILEVPKLFRERLEMEEPVDRKFPAYLDKTLDLPDRQSQSEEVDGKLIGAIVPFSGDYRVFSHHPQGQMRTELSGSGWVQNIGLKMIYFRKPPIDNEALQKAIQSDLDCIESILAISQVEIAKHNQEMSELIPQLITARRATIR